MADHNHKPKLFSHEKIETSNFLMIVLTLLVVSVGALVEIVPLYFQRSTTQPVDGLKPYTALQLAGRDVYIREGCYNCHSQMIRPIRAETERYGEYSKPGEFVWDHPFQWGSRRIGPDLQRVGGKYPDLWHVRHMDDPRAITAGSIMPAYPWLLTDELDFDSIPRVMRAHQILGVPYSDQEVADAREAAREQGEAVAAEIVKQGGPEGLSDRKIVALIAYLQRLGTDIMKPEPVALEEEVGTAEADADEPVVVEEAS